MDFDELYPNRFMKAGEFKGKDVTLTITKVILEELAGKVGPEKKGILCFARTTKQLVLNKTNGLCLKALFGRNTDEWIGKKVTFFPAEIQFEDNDLAIRVRGSPDITAPVTFELKLARKKPRMVTLQPTGSVKVTPAKTAAAQPPAPAKPITAPVTTHGPPPEDEEPVGKRTTVAPAKAARRLVLEDKSTTPDNVDPVTGEVPFEDESQDPFGGSEEASGL
jgi:hypothetical protein